MASGEMPPTDAKQPETSLAQYDKRLLWRLGAWGGAATVSLAVAVIVSQTALGHKRLQVVLAGQEQPDRVGGAVTDHDTATSVVDLTSAKLAAVERNTAATRAETRRLSLQVNKLSADSFRFTGRLSSLEHQIDGITGSIKKQAEQAAAAAVAKAIPPKPAYDRAFDMNAPVISPPATTFPRLALIMPPAPGSASSSTKGDASKSTHVTMEDVATTSAVKAMPKAESTDKHKTEPKTEPNAGTKAEIKAKTNAKTNAETKAKTLSEAKTQSAISPKPDLKVATDAKPTAAGIARPQELKAEVEVEPKAAPAPKRQIALEPESKSKAEFKSGPEPKSVQNDTAAKVAIKGAVKAASMTEPERKRNMRRRSSYRHGYGVDLGGADTVTVVNAQWAAVKANFGPLLVGLRPTAVRDHRFLSGGSFRLVVGRMHSLEAAERLCTRFARQQVSCQPIEFDDGRVIWR